MSNFDDILRFIPDDASVILNVGANNGAETNKFLETFPNCHVYSFEPEPRAIAKYRQIVDSPRATLIEEAVGSENGTATFYRSSGVQPGYTPEQMPEGWDQSGSIRKPAHHLTAYPWVKFDSTIRVNVTTLDSWASRARVAHVDFIWADVQGAEEDMIRGARKVLSFTKFLYTEYSNNELYQDQMTLVQLCALLPDFRLVKDFGCDVLLENVSLQ